MEQESLVIPVTVLVIYNLLKLAMSDRGSTIFEVKCIACCGKIFHLLAGPVYENFIVHISLYGQT